MKKCKISFTVLSENCFWWDFSYCSTVRLLSLPCLSALSENFYVKHLANNVGVVFFSLSLVFRWVFLPLSILSHFIFSVQVVVVWGVFDMIISKLKSVCIANHKRNRTEKNVCGRVVTSRKKSPLKMRLFFALRCFHISH